MDFSNTIIICVLYKILAMDFVFSLPTFGSEHVHIKVHLPPNYSNTKDVIKSQQLLTNHKIIHHYQHHQSPFQKVPNKEIVPVLENFYLSELDKLHSHDHLHQHEEEPKFFEETFLVETLSNNPQPKNEATNTIEIMQQHRHEQYANQPVETITLTESNQNHYDTSYKFQQQENIDQHIGAVKFVAENSFDQYQRKKNLEEVIELIEAPKFITSIKGHGHEPQVNEVVNEEPEIESSLNQRPKNHNYDIQYDYVTPEKMQSFHYQEVPIYQDIPVTQRPSPMSTVIIEEHIKYKPFEGSFNHLQQDTQNIKQTSMTYTGEEQGIPKYLTDYRKYLPSSENPQSFNASHLNFLKQSLPNIHSNTPDDNSQNQANPTAAETYMGYDSYSAAHVQGLGSGGYSNHKPF